MHAIRTSRRRYLGGTLALAACAVTGVARGQGYPDRLLTLVNPYPAGTASDITSRQFAKELALVLKEPVVVINRGT